MPFLCNQKVLTGDTRIGVALTVRKSLWQQMALGSTQPSSISNGGSEIHSAAIALCAQNSRDMEMLVSTRIHLETRLKKEESYTPISPLCLLDRL